MIISRDNNGIPSMARSEVPFGYVFRHRITCGYINFGAVEDGGYISYDIASNSPCIHHVADTNVQVIGKSTIEIVELPEQKYMERTVRELYEGDVVLLEDQRIPYIFLGSHTSGHYFVDLKDKKAISRKLTSTSCLLIGGTSLRAEHV